MEKKLVHVTSLLSVLIIKATFIAAVSQAATINGLCLTEPEFTNFTTMTQDAIQTWLTNEAGFLGQPFTDVDGKPTNAAEEIFNAARNNKINPQVLLTTLRKEAPGLKYVTTPPADPDFFRRLAGWDVSDLIKPKTQKSAREQIQDMAAQLRRDFYDRLSQCQNTPRGWDVDVGRLAGDEPGDERDPAFNNILVTPESKAIASLYAYTGWVGAALGGGRSALRPGKIAGGNGLFCELWSQFVRQYGFGSPPVSVTLSPQPLTMSCAPPTPTQPSRCLSVNVSGGTPGPDGYQWSITGPNLTTTEGVLTVTGVNKQNVQVKPPDNTGSGVAGTAYVKRIAHVGSDCSLNLFNGVTWVCYNCAGVEFTCPPSGDPCFGQTCPQQNCGAGAGDCGQLVCGLPKCACLQPTQNVGDPASLELARSGGAVCNTRTQAVKDAGCKPCAVEMQGATVTVRDAAGTPVTTTATVK